MFSQASVSHFVHGETGGGEGKSVLGVSISGPRYLRGGVGRQGVQVSMVSRGGRYPGKGVGVQRGRYLERGRYLG